MHSNNNRRDLKRESQEPGTSTNVPSPSTMSIHNGSNQTSTAESKQLKEDAFEQFTVTGDIENKELKKGQENVRNNFLK